MLIFVVARVCAIIRVFTQVFPFCFLSLSLAAMFIGTSQMPFPAQPQGNFQAFPAMGGPMPPTTMMGAVMGQGGAMMGQNTGMMVGMTMPNGFMGNAPAGVMGVAPGMMGAQAGAMTAGVVPPQNMYTMQPGQQPQWSMGQVKDSTFCTYNIVKHKRCWICWWHHVEALAFGVPKT